MCLRLGPLLALLVLRCRNRRGGACLEEVEEVEECAWKRYLFPVAISLPLLLPLPFGPFPSRMSYSEHLRSSPPLAILPQLSNNRVSQPWTDTFEAMSLSSVSPVTKSHYVCMLPAWETFNTHGVVQHSLTVQHGEVEQ